MNHRCMKSFLFSLLSVLALSACGGGGGGGTPAALDNNPPADPNAFSLTPIKTLGPNTLTFSLTGSDTNSVNYTATLKITNTPNLIIRDKSGTQINNVTSVKAESALTNTGTGNKVTTVGTSYYAPGYILVITTLGENPVTATCTPDSYNAPPNSAVVGDHGDNFATLSCPSNTKIVITWRLDAGATADEAKFVVTETSYVNDIVDSTEEDGYIIDHAGNIKGIEVVVTKDGVIRTLAGDRQ